MVETNIGAGEALHVTKRGLQVTKAGTVKVNYACTLLPPVCRLGVVGRAGFAEEIRTRWTQLATDPMDTCGTKRNASDSIRCDSLITVV